ncbi:MAG: aminotransferase class I/II-fold pyridoxal phosphate-dependent enzyme [Candidatus Riflebacteria bacterium]|nr:aminotransferase class I/II-fold pyridoxal phosphate-dependent enzyme [Candidatus Riflebacteria bacterium]
MRDFALEVYFSKWEFSARYHMTASDIESMKLSELLAMASPEDREAFDQQWLGYTETYGNPQLREEIAKTYDTAAASNILCFAGAEEGIYVAMRILLNKESHAIVVVPNYQAAETIPMEICDVSGIPLDAGNNWSLDINRLKSLIRPNTKLISINFPNNPTGAVLKHSVFQELIEICRERGIYLFSDEVYRLVERDASVRLPPVGDIYEKGLSLNVMSKAYGLSGLRIGWIMTRDTGLLQKMERYKHYLSICNSAPSERLAIIALKSRERILERNRALVNTNAEKLEAFFNEFHELFEWYRPDGGCVGFPRYKGPLETNQFCEDLVEKTGILLLPPKVYHSELMETPQDRFRIGFGRANIEEGLSVFRNYLKNA